MLINDSVTAAVEIPVFLTSDDIAYYRGRGFKLDFDSQIITGHIDFLQLRSGFLHILDYKPEARKEKHAVTQLTIYALALSRRTGLMTFPQVVIDGHPLGGYDELEAAEADGRLDELAA